jgi:SNF2 family DNA or RNA helicase
VRGGEYVAVPWHAGLAQLVPHAKPFVWAAERMLLMPNRTEEARLARNLGIHVPAPILTRYDWSGTVPWDIQRSTAAVLTESERCYVLSELGTGKTRAVLYALDYMLRHGIIKRALIVAPLSTLTPVWEREIFQLMLKFATVVLYGSRAKRLQLLAQGTPICIINHHGLRVLGQHAIDAHFDAVVLDELAIYRTKNTDVWKAAEGVVKAPSTKYVWGLTGAPTPNAPTDAWAQVRLLTPARTVRSFTAFRDLTMRRITSFKWLPRPEANTVVQAAMAPSVRYRRDDVMELPDCTTVERAVTLDDDAERCYKTLYAKARMQTLAGDVTAINQAVLQNKLLQISCGYLYTDDKRVYEMSSKGRLEALEEVLAETDHKVLVLVPYLHALTGVTAHLRKSHHDVEMVHGGTGLTRRNKIFGEFQSGASPRIIAAHPQCLSHGLTLTEADTIVWYSPTTSYETYDQANHRINRPGQIHKTMIVHMVGTPVERATYARLRSKEKMQSCLLDLFHQQEKPF